MAEPPVYGDLIDAEEHVFTNDGAVMLDDDSVTIGLGTLIWSNVPIFTRRNILPGVAEPAFLKRHAT
jgi:acetyltransferase-like isoleucine patch superfamily enzyme